MLRFLVIALFFAVPAGILYPQSSPATIILQAGVYPIRSNNTEGWNPLWNARIGMKLPTFSERLQFGLMTEYFAHDYVSNTGTGQRHDLAFYPALVGFDIIELGLGLYFSWRDLNIPNQVQPRKLFGGFFYQVGASRTIPVGEGWGLPIGIYYRGQEYGGGFSFAIKAGIEFSVGTRHAP